MALLLIRVLVLPDRTELDVIDEGPGIANIDLAMQEGYSTAPDHIREMGLCTELEASTIFKNIKTFQDPEK